MCLVLLCFVLFCFDKFVTWAYSCDILWDVLYFTHIFHAYFTDTRVWLHSARCVTVEGNGKRDRYRTTTKHKKPTPAHTIKHLI